MDFAVPSELAALREALDEFLEPQITGERRVAFGLTEPDHRAVAHTPRDPRKSSNAGSPDTCSDSSAAEQGKAR